MTRADVEERSGLVLAMATGEPLASADDCEHRRAARGTQPVLRSTPRDELQKRVRIEDYRRAGRFRSCAGCVPASIAASSAARSPPYLRKTSSSASWSRPRRPRAMHSPCPGARSSSAVSWSRRGSWRRRFRACQEPTTRTHPPVPLARGPGCGVGAAQPAAAADGARRHAPALRAAAWQRDPQQTGKALGRPATAPQSMAQQPDPGCKQPDPG